MEYIENFKLGIEDIDKENLITNKAILKIFENIGGYQSDKIGYGVLDIKQNRKTWILLEWKVKVIKRVMYGENLEVKTWPRKIDKFYTYRDYEMYNENGECCIIGTSKWLLLDIDNKKIINLNDEIKNKYEIVSKNVFNQEKIESIQEPESYQTETRYKVLRKDIDFNGHMHNLNYLDLAYEALPEEIYNNSNFDNIRITYKKGIKLGENIKCKYAKTEDRNIITIFSENEDIKHAIIELF